MAKIGLWSISALLATLVLLFAFQGGYPEAAAGHRLLAVPILIQVFFNSALAYWLNRAVGEKRNMARPSALIGASNFSSWRWRRRSRCSASNPGPRSPPSSALIEVPVMLLVVKVVNRSKGWYEERAKAADMDFVIAAVQSGFASPPPISRRMSCSAWCRPSSSPARSRHWCRRPRSRASSPEAPKWISILPLPVPAARWPSAQVPSSRFSPASTEGRRAGAAITFLFAPAGESLALSHTGVALGADPPLPASCLRSFGIGIGMIMAILFRWSLPPVVWDVRAFGETVRRATAHAVLRGDAGGVADRRDAQGRRCRLPSGRECWHGPASAKRRRSSTAGCRRTRRPARKTCHCRAWC